MFNELLNRRSTFFVKEQIVVNNENVIKIASSLSEFGLVPSANKGIGFKITPNGIIQEEVLSLEMKTFDDSFKIVFNVDRIDLIRNKISATDNIEDIDSFIEKTKKIFSVLKNAYSLIVTRVALCTNTCYDIPSAFIDNVYGKLVSSDETPVEWQIRKVLRGNLVSESHIQINSVYTLSRNLAQIGFENTAKDRILCEIDINTAPVVNLQLKDSDIDAFWTAASTDIIEATGNYFEQLSYE